MSEETTNEEELSAEELEARETAHRMYLSEIMQQLTESERFQRFFKINYDVQTFFDEKEKTFNIRLIELPPELAASRLRQMAANHAEEHLPKVEMATMEEIQRIAEETKKNGQ